MPAFTECGVVEERTKAYRGRSGTRHAFCRTAYIAESSARVPISHLASDPQPGNGRNSNQFASRSQRMAVGRPSPVSTASTSKTWLMVTFPIFTACKYLGGGSKYQWCETQKSSLVLSMIFIRFISKIERNFQQFPLFPFFLLFSLFPLFSFLSFLLFSLFFFCIIELQKIALWPSS